MTAGLRKKILVGLSIISLLGLAFFSLAHAMPSLLQIPDIDYSIFEYFGQRMREGQLPYRDIYDHKPPLIFFLNYWGLVLGSGSRWGIWALQLAAVSVAGLIGFLGLRPIFGLYPAWLASAGFLVNLIFVHEGGNLTEEYALPFQFAAISPAVSDGSPPARRVARIWDRRVPGDGVHPSNSRWPGRWWGWC